MIFPPQRPQQFLPRGIPRGMGRMPGVGRMPNRFFPGANPIQPTANPGGLQNMIQSFLGNSGGAASYLPTQGGGFANTLSNLQQVLRVVETTAPIVKQYGPVVKNLPAMFKMMKALQDSGDEEEGEESSKESLLESGEESEDNESESKETKREDEVEMKAAKPKKSRTGESVPKLFI